MNNARLRFDKVVARVRERLAVGLRDTVPAGMTVVVAMTAPIRLPAKTAATLEDKVRTILARGAPRRDVTAAIHGNRVRIRVLTRQPTGAKKAMLLVHNADADPRAVLEMAKDVRRVRIPAPHVKPRTV